MLNHDIIFVVKSDILCVSVDNRSKTESSKPPPPPRYFIILLLAVPRRLFCFGDFRCGVLLYIVILLLLAVPRRLFCFGDFRCGVLLFIVILVTYEYKNM